MKCNATKTTIWDTDDHWWSRYTKLITMEIIATHASATNVPKPSNLSQRILQKRFLSERPQKCQTWHKGVYHKGPKSIYLPQGHSTMTHLYTSYMMHVIIHKNYSLKETHATIVYQDLVLYIFLLIYYISFDLD